MSGLVTFAEACKLQGIPDETTGKVAGALLRNAGWPKPVTSRTSNGVQKMYCLADIRRPNPLSSEEAIRQLTASSPGRCFPDDVLIAPLGEPDDLADQAALLPHPEDADPVSQSVISAVTRGPAAAGNDEPDEPEAPPSPTPVPPKPLPAALPPTSPTSPADDVDIGSSVCSDPADLASLDDLADLADSACPVDSASHANTDSPVATAMDALRDAVAAGEGWCCISSAEYLTLLRSLLPAGAKVSDTALFSLVKENADCMSSALHPHEKGSDTRGMKKKYCIGNAVPGRPCSLHFVGQGTPPPAPVGRPSKTLPERVLQVKALQKALLRAKDRIAQLTEELAAAHEVLGRKGDIVLRGVTGRKSCTEPYPMKVLRALLELRMAGIGQESSRRVLRDIIKLLSDGVEMPIPSRWTLREFEIPSGAASFAVFLEDVARTQTGGGGLGKDRQKATLSLAHDATSSLGRSSVSLHVVTAHVAADENRVRGACASALPLKNGKAAGKTSNLQAVRRIVSAHKLRISNATLSDHASTEAKATRDAGGAIVHLRCMHHKVGGALKYAVQTAGKALMMSHRVDPAANVASVLAVLDPTNGRSTAGVIFVDAELGKALDMRYPRGLGFARERGSKWHARPQQCSRLLKFSASILEMVREERFTPTATEILTLLGTPTVAAYCAACHFIGSLYLRFLNDLKPRRLNEETGRLEVNFEAGWGVLRPLHLLARDLSADSADNDFPALRKHWGQPRHGEEEVGRAEALEVVKDHHDVFAEVWVPCIQGFASTLARFIGYDEAAMASASPEDLPSLPSTQDLAECVAGNASFLAQRAPNLSSAALSGITQSKVNRFLLGYGNCNNARYAGSSASFFLPSLRSFFLHRNNICWQSQNR